VTAVAAAAAAAKTDRVYPTLKHHLSSPATRMKDNALIVTRKITTIAFLAAECLV